MKIKICGLRDAANIREILPLKPDLLGFIFYHGSPRYAGSILKPDDVIGIPVSIPRTGVFVNADPYEIHGLQWKYKLDYIQLHGDETPKMCEKITQSGAHVIKAFRIHPGFRFRELMDYVPVCRYFLFDTSGTGYGGSGSKFDWNLLDRYELGHPFFLSGGIGPSDAPRILSIRHPALVGVDINSKFELEPGIKNIELLKKFFRSVRKKEK